jgi:hypothetical protein
MVLSKLLKCFTISVAGGMDFRAMLMKRKKPKKVVEVVSRVYVNKLSCRIT